MSSLYERTSATELWVVLGVKIDRHKAEGKRILTQKQFIKSMPLDLV
jgi:hypothetical protein